MVISELLFIPIVEISFDVIAGIALLIAAVIFVWRKGVLPVTRGIKQMLKELEQLPESRNKINYIYSEIHPNGETSIKDAVNRIENKLLHVEQKQNVYLLEASQGIYECNAVGECISVNRTYLRLTGRTEKEVLGRGWVKCIAEYDRDRVKSVWDEAIEHGMEFSSIYDMVDIDGNITKVTGVAYPMVSPTTSKIIGWLGTVSEIVVER